MAEQSNPIPPNPMYEAAFARRRRWESAKRWLRRSGCLILFLVWLALMAFPCTLVTLLVNRELTYQRSDLPDHHLRLFLLQQPDERGFGLERGSIKSGSEEEGQYCIVTTVNYLLWEGEGKDIHYCNCYEKIGEEWSPTLVGGDEYCQALPTTPEAPE
jgi:hypothetical protein